MPVSFLHEFVIQIAASWSFFHISVCVYVCTNHFIGSIYMYIWTCVSVLNLGSPNWG
ncbi:hypothetical protein HanRHA438_Chr13g0625851 [Helianthus annuus]|nr:hypothetical protein HanRHA438_Chr13g0625851 [Helianthus annuus]